MTSLTPFIPYFIISYLLMFAGGYIIGRDKGIEQQIKTTKKWTAYDRT